MELQTNLSRRFLVSYFAVSVFFGLFFCAMTIANIVSFGARALAVLFFLLLFGVILYCVYDRILNLKLSNGCYRLILFTAVFTLVAAQVIVARGIYTRYGWDVERIIDSATRLANQDQFLEIKYFTNYPNNIFLLLVFTDFFRLVRLFSSNYLLWAICLNIVLVDLAVFLTYLCAKRLFHKKGKILAALLCISLIGMNPWFIVPYSDTFGMLFPVLIFYLYLKMEDDRIPQWLLCILMGAASVIGFFIKPQTAIITIAIFLVALLSHKLNKERLKILLKRFGCLFLSLLITFFSATAYMNYRTKDILPDNLKYQNEMPFTHFLMMGMNPETLGNFYLQDVLDTMGIPGKEEKMQFNLKVIQDRLSHYGFAGYVTFLGQKSAMLYHDGSFGYGQEGGFRRSKPFHDGPLSVALQNTLFQDSGGYQLYHLMLDAFWLLVLLFLFLPAVFQPKRRPEPGVAVLRLTIIGLTLFLLLFEGRPRYLYHQLPIFILLAVYGMTQVNYKEKLNALIRKTGVTVRKPVSGQIGR